MFRIDVRCLACGRLEGTLEVDRWPTAGPCLFQTAHPSVPVVEVAAWTALRCSTCRGNVYADDIRAVRIYPPVAWDDDASHRRGRPPRRLVAQRKASLETDDD